MEFLVFSVKGSSAELFVRCLVDHLSRALVDFVSAAVVGRPVPRLAAETARLRQESGGWYASDEPEAEGWLCPALFQSFDEALPGEIKEGLDIDFAGVLSVIRNFRNDSGHPSGKILGREQTYVLLQMFVPYCKKVYQLIEFFKP